MKCLARVSLSASPVERDLLLRTMTRVNGVCNEIGLRAWSQQLFGLYKLQCWLYHDLRREFGLSSQMTIRCLARVANRYRLDRSVPCAFDPYSALVYDDKLLSWNLLDSWVSIWTLDGRLRLTFAGTSLDRTFLEFRQGETDLVFDPPGFALSALCEVRLPHAGRAVPRNNSIGSPAGVGDETSTAPRQKDNTTSRHAPHA